jgi:NAD(P)-dependent dehydrogenase (short-subunit alcohol dehydrogenase family)
MQSVEVRRLICLAGGSQEGLEDMAKVAIVSGASRGIGRATALLAARRGWDVCINYATAEDSAREVAAEVEKLGRRALLVRADMGREEDIRSMFATVDEVFGAPDAVVCNAGITGPAGRLEALKAEALRRVVDVNLIGVILTAREAVLRMSTRRGGRGGSIVLLSSVAGFLGGGGDWLHYAATKGAINTFTLGLAREVAAEGIRVNAVSPGIIDTEIHAAAGASERVTRLVPALPMPRIGTADEVAEAILFFMGEEAAYSIGAILPVTGGR